MRIDKTYAYDVKDEYGTYFAPWLGKKHIIFGDYIDKFGQSRANMVGKGAGKKRKVFQLSAPNARAVYLGAILMSGIPTAGY